MVLGYVKREIVLSPSFEKVRPPPGPIVRDGSTLCRTRRPRASRLTQVFVFKVVKSLKRKLRKTIHGCDLDFSINLWLWHCVERIGVPKSSACLNTDI